MIHVETGKKYVVLKKNKNGDISFKDVICQSEFVNFQKAQVEIKTTKGKYYPLYDVYKSKEEAIKHHYKTLKRKKISLKKEIKIKEKEIKNCKEKMIETEEAINMIENKFKNILKKENKK